MSEKLGMSSREIAHNNEARTLSDRELLGGGAAYTEENPNVLQPTSEQVETIRRKEAPTSFEQQLDQRAGEFQELRLLIDKQLGGRQEGYIDPEVRAKHE